MTVDLRGLCWNDPRRTRPMAAASATCRAVRLAAFPASDDAAAITGAPYLVDGGPTAKLGV